MASLVPVHRWRLPDVDGASPELLAATTERGLGERLALVLANRGYEGASDVAALLGEPEEILHDPHLLPDADGFRERVEAAVQRRERVLVFGDFDADGLTGLAILVEAFRSLGLDASPYVPSRVDEGHGLSLPAVAHAAAEGRSLIVTVDCGTTSHAEIDAAAAAGIDVLVTDHHQVPAVLPNAAAVVNPHRAGSAYPDSRLAGSGVAFKLACLLLADRPGGRDESLALAELAAIGTVADMAPILGENRAIARIGLERLRAAPRPGLAALLRSAGVAPESVDLETVGYVIAPRLNAVGRVGEAAAAAELLLARTDEDAERLAAELEAANVLRRELSRAALLEARAAALLDPDAPIIVVAGDWPVGIVGLVAGRIADEHGRPAVVVSRVGEPWRASARGPRGFDLAAAFAACGDLFERHGGHPGAAGCSFASDRYDTLRERLRELAGSFVVDTRRELVLDLVVGCRDVDYRLLRELAALEPTGPGNPPVLVGIEGLVVTRVRPAGEKHAQLTLRKGLEVLDAIAFERGDLTESVREGQGVDVVARLGSREWGGYESLRLDIRDVAPAGTLRSLRAGVNGDPMAATAA